MSGVTLPNLGFSLMVARRPYFLRLCLDAAALRELIACNVEFAAHVTMAALNPAPIIPSDSGTNHGSTVRTIRKHK